jgi:hypothetical protein
MYWCTVNQCWKEVPQTGAIRRPYMGPSEMHAAALRNAIRPGPGFWRAVTTVQPVIQAPPAPKESAPPSWYVQSTKALGDAMAIAVNAVSSHSYDESASDSFYLDRLTEALRRWEADIQARANASRRSRPLG